MEQKRKKQKRNPLSKNQTPKVRHEFIDYSEEDLRRIKRQDIDAYNYLVQFIDEREGANITKVTYKDGRRKVKAGHIHSTNALAKDVYDQNNARNNDVYGVSKINGLLQYGFLYGEHEDHFEKVLSRQPSMYEDAILSSIEKKDNVDDILTKEEYLEMKDLLTPEMLLFYLNLYEND